MSIQSVPSLATLSKEGAKCRVALKAFTESLINKLPVSPQDADLMREADDTKNEKNAYFYFPFCFREVFPSVPIEQVKKIAVSGILWMSYMRTQDDTIDNASSTLPNILFIRDLYLRESLHLLYEILPPNSRFWTLYSDYFHEYMQAVLLEKTNHSMAESAYNDDEFHTIAKGKATMAKYPIAAQAVLSGQEHDIPLLAESVDCYHIAYQYWDDLVDWKEDLAHSSYTLLLTQALKYLTPEKRVMPSQQLHENIARILYYSGLAEEHLQRSFDWSQRAHDLSLRAGCKVWAEHVQRLQKRTSALQTDLRTIAHRNLKHTGDFTNCLCN